VYFQTAEALRTGNAEYSQFPYRTPGYPAFLAFGQILFGEKGFGGIMGLQFLLGLFMPVMLYGIFRRWTEIRWVAAVGSLAFFADRYSVGMQTVLLTEWLTAWVMVASLLAWFVAFERRSLSSAALAGAVLGVASLVRPSMSLLPYFLALGSLGVTYLYQRQSGPWRSLLLWNLGVFGVCWLVSLPWRLFLWFRFGVFALSMIAPVGLSNHVGSIMEKAPDRYSDIRDLYVSLRPKDASHIDTCWGTLWEYQRRTGKSHVEAARRLGAASRSLVLSHPGLYLSNLGTGWYRIWTDSPFYVIDSTDPYLTPQGIFATSYFNRVVMTGPLSPFYRGMEVIVWKQRELMVWIPWILLGIGAWLSYLWRANMNRVISLWAVLGTVFYHVCVHIAGNFTEFGRYRLPVQPLWVPFLGFVLTLGVAQAMHTMRRGLSPVPEDSRSPLSSPTSSRDADQQASGMAHGGSQPSDTSPKRRKSPRSKR
jgi:hypothetical protein